MPKTAWQAPPAAHPPPTRLRPALTGALLTIPGTGHRADFSPGTRSLIPSLIPTFPPPARRGVIHTSRLPRRIASPSFTDRSPSPLTACRSPWGPRHPPHAHPARPAPTPPRRQPPAAPQPGCPALAWRACTPPERKPPSSARSMHAAVALGGHPEPWCKAHPCNTGQNKCHPFAESLGPAPMRFHV
jgi:hypothetical protein